MTKAWINAVSEGSQAEAIQWLAKLDAENDRLREALQAAIDAHPFDASWKIKAKAALEAVR